MMLAMRIPYRKPGPFSQIKLDPVLTAGKFSELKNKLERLKNVSKPQAMEEVSRLAELGDFSENVAYQFSKGKLRGINQRILTIENQLDHATVITPQQQTDIVQIGHHVIIARDNKERTYHILGSSETDPHQGIISYNSPLGAALMGSRVGDTVKIKLADKEVEYIILKVF